MMTNGCPRVFIRQKGGMFHFRMTSSRGIGFYAKSVMPITGYLKLTMKAIIIGTVRPGLLYGLTTLTTEENLALSFVTVG